MGKLWTRYVINPYKISLEKSWPEILKCFTGNPENTGEINGNPVIPTV